MRRASDTLHLLLARDDDESHDQPIAGQGLPAKTARDAPRPEPGARTTYMRRHSGDPDDLAAQRWGIIAPEGTLGDRLLDVVRPLIAARSAEQDAPAIILRTPAGATMSLPDAQLWRDKVYLELDKPAAIRRREADQPRYLLILGDLHQVPESVHQIQVSDSFVGRLAFTGENGDPDESRYAAYVDKVLRWQQTRSAVAPAQSRFFVVQDGTAATATAMTALVDPALRLLATDSQIKPASPWQRMADTILTAPSELLDAVSTPDPTVLFTVSHGTGAPRSGWSNSSRQRLLQGSMHFGQEGKLTASDVGEQPFLPGGMWFMFACYAAGTPSSSHFRHWLERLRQVGQFGANVDSVLAGLPRPGERPFIAALPQALLASAKGPLAFIGHLDLTWTSAFQDMGDDGLVSQPARFAQLVKALLQRKRAGNALHEVLRYIADANTQLAIFYNQKEAARSEQDNNSLGHYWMTRQDLMSYVLLGDPAVRLPSSCSSAVPLAGPSSSVPPRVPPQAAAQSADSAARFSALMGFTVLPSTAKAADGLPISIEQLERAIIKYQAAELYDKTLTVESVAKEYGLSASELRGFVATYREAGRSALSQKRKG